MANIGFMPLPPGPGSRAFSVVKSDTAVLPPNVVGLYIGGAGNVTVVMAGQQDVDAVTYTAVPVGTFLPISVVKVMAATTATLILAITR